MPTLKPLTHKTIRSRAIKIIQTAGGVSDSGGERTDYSGRGMFGRVSSVALTTSVHPCSPAGEKLRALGLSCDNMGRDWIYYTRS